MRLGWPSSSRPFARLASDDVGKTVQNFPNGKLSSLKLLVNCPGDFVSTDAVHRIGVCPPKRFRGPGVSSNVFAKLAGEIGNRGENATGDDIPLDLGKP